MEDSNVSVIEHLVVNRGEVVSKGCTACGQGFAPDPKGVRALSVAAAPDNKVYVFCQACGDSILGHLGTAAARQRYEWDWVVRLHRTPRQMIDEADLEEAVLREGHPIDNGAFQAFGRTYESERAAIISFLYKVRASEANGGEAFAAWAKACKTERLKTGIRVIAEREAYHARVFDRRLAELGAKRSWGRFKEGRRFKEYLGNAKIPDEEKLLSYVRSTGDPEEAIRPICEFAALIKEDLQTKDALLLFSEDEFSSATWAWKTCAALSKQH